MKNDSNLMSDKVEYPAKLISRLTAGTEKRLEKILNDGTLNDFPELNLLDVDNVRERYGILSANRFYRGLLDEFLEQDELDEKPTSKKLASIIGYFTGSKLYDFILEKTGSHMLANGAKSAVLMETLVSLTTLGVFAYASKQEGVPFIPLIQQYSPQILPLLAEIGVFGFAVGAGVVLGIVGLERILYKNTPEHSDKLIDWVRTARTKFYEKIGAKKHIGIIEKPLKTMENFILTNRAITKEDVKEDISIYLKEFYNVWERYRSSLLKTTKYSDISLQQLNGMYMLVTSSLSKNLSSSFRAIRKHDKKVLPAISEGLGRRLSRRSIIHLCPEGVGGFTLIFPSVIMGKFTRKHAYGPVFLNTKRLLSAPSYDFALAHEFAHAAGKASEPLANYFALKCIDSLNRSFPDQGYDLYGATNRLAFAVAGLRDKIKDQDEFLAELGKITTEIDGIRLGMPKFIYEAIKNDFNPSVSPLPPMDGLDTHKLNIDDMFKQLYMSSSYTCIKLAKLGRL